jgi:hypothetical protein
MAATIVLHLALCLLTGELSQIGSNLGLISGFIWWIVCRAATRGFKAEPPESAP